jgi:ATP-dependent DNA helicase RecG
MAAPPPTSTRSPLDQPVTTLWGVGTERAKQLARLDIHTIDDLLLHRPRRYEDRRKFRSIAELQLDESTLTRGKIVAMGVKRYRKGTKSVFEFVLEDGTARLHCRWWNLPFMENYFETGDEVVVFGRPLNLKPRTMDHPETEVIEGREESFIHFNRIVPVYPLTEGLPQRWLRGLIFRTLEKFVGTKRTEKTNPNDPLNDIIPRNEAIRMLHFPKEMPDVETARRRLALSEFMSLQVDIQTRRKNFESNAQGLPCSGDNHLIKPFLARLGFKLTAAQTRVLREIRKDMGGAHPMRRLLQGDVGSGKTAVAACTALMALESGFSVALMAPTEILAEQHYHNFQKWFEPLGVNVELETANRKTSGMLRNQATIQSSRANHASLFIGTHALIELGLAIPNLGLVMIDEQHKFGVAQRERLVRKGRYPHLLVTTATPIPRTLGLTLYGDLDVSVIDELPPGRGSIKTFVRTTDKLPKVREFIREKLANGRQAYVVYPRVEDDTGGVKAVTKEFENLKSALAPSRVGLLHGRLPGAEAERVMTAFRAGDIKVLLATSLIEVGVDVSNATVMLIENAETFGLAQLHQLRGRIGRGAHESYCILISDAKNPEARERLRVLEETNDGFRISEADLKLRGPGELLGRQQSGETRFRFGDLINDYDLVLQARELAGRMTGVVGRTAGL